MTPEQEKIQSRMKSHLKRADREVSNRLEHAAEDIEDYGITADDLLTDLIQIEGDLLRCRTKSTDSGFNAAFESQKRRCLKFILASRKQAGSDLTKAYMWKVRADDALDCLQASLHKQEMQRGSAAGVDKRQDEAKARSERIRALMLEVEEDTGKWSRRGMQTALAEGVYSLNPDIASTADALRNPISKIIKAESKKPE
ncbi:MAG: hypothetical protein AB7U63_16080 [Porticoccaceae bacterium]